MTTAPPNLTTNDLLWSILQQQGGSVMTAPGNVSSNDLLWSMHSAGGLAGPGGEGDSGGISVKNFGAVGDGVADDRPEIQEALDAVGAYGGHVVFPAGNYKIVGPVVPKSNTLITGAGATITQATQFQPAFDLFNVSGCTIRDLILVNGPGSPPNQGSGSTRGDADYCFSAGVWTNGERHTLKSLRIVNFAMGVYFSSSNGTTAVGDHVKRVGNTARDLEISGCNHGILLVNQSGTIIDGLYTHDHVDSSAGANPNHAFYVSGSEVNDRSQDMVFTNVVCRNCVFGHAFQAKYVTGLVLSNLHATNCNGLLSLVDCKDVNGSVISGIGDTATGTPSGIFSIITQANVINERINLDRVLLVKAVEAICEVQFASCNDSHFSNFILHTKKNGASPASSDVWVTGSRNTFTGFKLRNTGSSTARAFLFDGADNTAADFEIDNYTGIGQLTAASTGNNVFSYDPARQRRITNSQYHINNASGSPAPYFLTRRPHVGRYVISGAGTYRPYPALETVTRMEYTVSAATTMNTPFIVFMAIGTVHDIRIVNTTGSPMGTITWDPLYSFITTAPASPAAGATVYLRFTWNGTNWKETPS